MISDLHGRLSASRILKLRDGLMILHQVGHGSVRLGTACSGSDLIVNVLEELLKFYSTMFGLNVTTTHCFACESVRFKQEWIIKHFQPGRLFPDLKELHQQVVRDIDGNDAVVELLDGFACGAECDSISALNGQRSDNWSCVEEADTSGRDTKTGGTAKSSFDFLQTNRPPFFMLENVKNLNVKAKDGCKTNLQMLILWGNSLGYYVVYTLLNCLDFGTPQHRERFYVVGVLISLEPFDQLVQHYPHPTWSHDMDAVIHEMSGMSQIPLHRFLLPDDDNEVVAANMELREEKERAKTKVKSSKRKLPHADDHDELGSIAQREDANNMQPKTQEYEINHLSAYSENGLAWPPTFSDAFLAKTTCLSLRQQQILHFDEMTEGFAEMLEQLVVRDLNMTIEWGHTRKDVLPTIVSSSVVWVRGCYLKNGVMTVIDRKVCGAELLNVQGFPLTLQDAGGSRSSEVEFSEKGKVDLAGNAFCAGHLIPVLSALIACAPWAEAFQIRTSMLSVPAVPPAVDEDISEAGSGCSDEGEEGCESEDDIEAKDDCVSSHDSDW
jgi:site-specific DNA-cytosine methylase